MPLFGSGASKIILCFPLIRFSHVSNDASAPVVGSGRGCPSSLSGVSPATPAAAVAARRPRNPRLYMRSLLVVRPDRKSTRLNSSHSQISYAVFCLKKKTDSYYKVFLVIRHARLSCAHYSASTRILSPLDFGLIPHRPGRVSTRAVCSYDLAIATSI